MFYVIIVFIYLHYQKISSPKTKKTLHPTFEKIKWSVSNVGEVGLEPTCNQITVPVLYKSKHVFAAHINCLINVVNLCNRQYQH